MACDNIPLRVGCLCCLLFLAGPSQAEDKPFDPVVWRDAQLARWREAFRDDNPLVRRRALHELAHLRYARIPALLKQAIADEDPRVRIRAMLLISRHGPARQLRPLLLGRLSDEKPTVRAAAARSMGRMTPAAGVGRLIDLLEDPVAGVRSAALQTLRGWTARAFDFAPQGDDEQRAKGLARWRVWWRASRSKSWLQRYAEALAAPQARGRRAAADQLARIGDLRAIPALIARLADSSAVVRAAAETALYSLSGRRDGDLARWRDWWGAHQSLGQSGWLPRLLVDPRRAVRVRAARWISEHDQVLQIPALIDALADEHRVVRDAAATALRQLSGLRFDFGPSDTPRERAEQLAVWRQWWGGASAQGRTRWLIMALGHPRAKIRARAATGLGRHGGPADAVHLLAALRDPSAVVRERAHSAFCLLTACRLPFDADAADDRRSEQLRAIQAWHQR